MTNQLTYDHLYLCHYRDHWIQQPRHKGSAWLVCTGDHPYNPDGLNSDWLSFRSEAEAIAYVDKQQPEREKE